MFPEDLIESAQADASGTWLTKSPAPVSTAPFRFEPDAGPLTGFDLEVYLGETGLYYRVLNLVPAEVKEAISAGGGVAEAEPEAVPAPGVPLFSF